MSRKIKKANEMSGSIVTIRINGQPYQLGCDKGQEAEIESYGQTVDEMVSSLASSVGQIGDARLLVMASILLAEKAAGGTNGTAGTAPVAPAASAPLGEMVDDAQIDQLEKLANTISKLAASLKSA